MSVLQGLSVVQLGAGIAAPVVGLLLADQGADVVAVRAPGATPLPGPGPDIWERGKRVLVLDWEQPDGLADLQRLIDAADVIIDGTPPGRLGTVGLRCPDDAIWLSLPGFPTDHPLRDTPAWEGAIGASVGLYDPPVGRRPGFTSLPAASMLGAFYGANAVIAALIARQRDGRGQLIEVPLAGAALSAVELTAVLTQQPPRSWTTIQWAASPFLAVYACAEGWVYAHLGQPAHLRRFLEHLAGDDDAEALNSALSAETKADPTRPASVREAGVARRRLGAIFRKKTALEWEALLDDLCVVAVRAPASWIDAAQPTATGEIVRLEHPERGFLPQPGVQVRIAAAPGEARPLDTREVLPGVVAAGWRRRTSWQVEPGEGSEPPLAGKTVLDLTQVIAGPVAARTLAQLGARVIRVENPRLAAAWADAFHVCFNSGKDSVAVDLSSPEGRDALLALVKAEQPDVVVHNFRPGVAERLGLDEASLRQLAPGLTYAHLSAYGATGPWGERPGWEQTAQAVTGMQLRYGGSRGPDLLPLPLNDLGTGLMGAFACQLGLLHRARGGEATRVETWLTATSTLLQSLTLFDPHPSRWREADGPGALGTGPLHRWYRASDQWFFLAAPGREDDVRRIGGLEKGELEEQLATASLAEWRRRAAAAGVANVVAMVAKTSVGEAMQQSWATDRGIVRRHDFAGLGELTEVCPPWHFSRTPPPSVPPAVPRGADSERLLAPIGHGAAAVDIPAPTQPEGRLRRAARDVGWAAAQARWALFLVRGRLGRALER